jgi:hypothetical protein
MDRYYWPSFTACYVDYVYYSGIYADYSAFSPDALSLWNADYRGQKGLMTREQATAKIETLIEGVIQSSLGGWPMEELLGQTGQHTEQLIRRGIESVQAILSAARAIPEHVDMDNLPPQTPRPQNVIHVTGHHLLLNKGHVALEYASPSTGAGLVTPATLSGEAERWPPSICWPILPPPNCSFGKLLARTNKESDQWFFNFTVGTVLPFIGTPGNYWNNHLVPRHTIYMNLPHSLKLNYNWLPNLSPNTYNSNGYVRGLNGTGGFFVVPQDMNSVYPGWNQPAPEQKFR